MVKKYGYLEYEDELNRYGVLQGSTVLPGKKTINILIFLKVVCANVDQSWFRIESRIKQTSNQISINGIWLDTEGAKMR